MSSNVYVILKGSSDSLLRPEVSICIGRIILELMKLIISFYSYMVFGYLLKNGRNTITSSYSITISLIELLFQQVACD